MVMEGGFVDRYCNIKVLSKQILVVQPFWYLLIVYLYSLLPVFCFTSALIERLLSVLLQALNYPERNAVPTPTSDKRETWKIKLFFFL